MLCLWVKRPPPHFAIYINPTTTGIKPSRHPLYISSFLSCFLSTILHTFLGEPRVTPCKRFSILVSEFPTCPQASMLATRQAMANHRQILSPCWISASLELHMRRCHSFSDGPSTVTHHSCLFWELLQLQNPTYTSYWLCSKNTSVSIRKCRFPPYNANLQQPRRFS